MDISSAILAEARGHLATLSHTPDPESAEAAGLWWWLERHPEALHHPYVQEHLERLSLGSAQSRLTHHLGWAFALGVPSPKVTACKLAQVMALHFPLETPELHIGAALCWHTASSYRSQRRGLTAGQCSVRVEVVHRRMDDDGRPRFKRGDRVYVWHEVNDWSGSTPGKGKDLIFNFWGRDVLGTASAEPLKISGNPPSYSASTAHLRPGTVWRRGHPDHGLVAVTGGLARVGEAAMVWDRELQ